MTSPEKRYKLPPHTQPRYTQQAMIDALRQARGLMAPAARMLQCDRGTVERYVKRYPAVATVIKEQRETIKDLTEGVLFTKIMAGEPWAVCFFLKTQAKDRGYIERVEHEHGGPDGQPIRITLNLGRALHERDDFAAPALPQAQVIDIEAGS